MSHALSDLDRVRQPITTAHGLPNAHYIDPAVHAEERDAVLFANWMGLAVASGIPEAGDAIPMTVLGMPLFIVRDREGAVRVFQNTCRHRGMILIEEPRKIEGAIRCPYPVGATPRTDVWWRRRMSAVRDRIRMIASTATRWG